MCLELPDISSNYDEQNMLTHDDVRCMEVHNTYMQYDAYILYADDSADEAFAYAIKQEMETKHGLKVNFLKYRH
jgi:hypothetical protein